MRSEKYRGTYNWTQYHKKPNIEIEITEKSTKIPVEEELTYLLTAKEAQSDDPEVDKYITENLMQAKKSLKNQILNNKLQKNLVLNIELKNQLKTG